MLAVESLETRDASLGLQVPQSTELKTKHHFKIKQSNKSKFETKQTSTAKDNLLENNHNSYTWEWMKLIITVRCKEYLNNN
jgi:hypothetical protein